MFFFIKCIFLGIQPNTTWVPSVIGSIPAKLKLPFVLVRVLLPFLLCFQKSALTDQSFPLLFFTCSMHVFSNWGCIAHSNDHSVCSYFQPGHQVSSMFILTVTRKHKGLTALMLKHNSFCTHILICLFLYYRADHILPK